MIRHSILLFVFFLVTINSLSAKSLKALFTYVAYTTPDNQSYAETYISFQGNSLMYKPVGDAFQASVEVTMIISQGEQVFFGDKYIVNSSLVTDVENNPLNFIDKQRFPLASGKYDLQLIFRDVNSEEEAIKANSTIEILYDKDQVDMSDIIFIDSYEPTKEQNLLSKSGFDMVPVIPYGDYFFDQSSSKMQFYAELYHMDKLIGAGESYLCSFSIVNDEDSKIIGNYRDFKKYQASPVQPIFSGFDVSKLASGNYRLIVEVRNRENTLITSRDVFFQRRNLAVEREFSIDAMENSFVGQINEVSQMTELLECIMPICDNLESVYVQNQIKGADLELMKRFFFNFWRKRDELNPEKAWLAYRKRVEAVNNEFSTFALKGYRSDRGRVYLQYGSPDQIENSEWENRAYPYQIWQYYRLDGGQTNKIFIFAEQAVGTNDYELIHSNADGEIYNPKWRRLLERNRTVGQDVDDNEFRRSNQENFGESINRNSILNDANRTLRTNDPNR